MSMSTMFRKYQINHPTHPSDTPVTGMSGATIWPLKEGALGGGIRVWPDKGFPRLKRRSFWTPLRLPGSSNCHHPFCSKHSLDNSPHHQIAIWIASVSVFAKLNQNYYKQWDGNAVFIICPLGSSLSFSIDLSCKEIMDFEKGSGTVFHQEWIVDSIADGWDDGWDSAGRGWSGLICPTSIQSSASPFSTSSALSSVFPILTFLIIMSYILAFSSTFSSVQPPFNLWVASPKSVLLMPWCTMAARCIPSYPKISPHQNWFHIVVYHQFFLLHFLCIIMVIIIQWYITNIFFWLCLSKLWQRLTIILLGRPDHKSPGSSSSLISF